MPTRKRKIQLRSGDTVELTEKQILFCEEYIVDLNGTQAAIRAGYSEKTGYSIANENLKKPEILAYIQDLMDERSERLEIDQDYVLGGIAEVIENARQVELVRDENGNILVQENSRGELVAVTHNYDPNVILRGQEMLGKHLKLFTEKREVMVYDHTEALEAGRKRVKEAAARKAVNNA